MTRKLDVESIEKKIYRRSSSYNTYKLINSLLTAYEILYQNFIYLPRIDTIMRNHFAKVGAARWPNIKDILRAHNALTLVDTHHLVTDPKPNNPNVIEIGGIHI
ncbi:uncharacterized protein LOC103505255 [Diaphorina citri]|uniref:Uncharacterized protein LOC103505255 n=1 Tax=Diaphorina citri TaxID=121845 RepID=A0A3Q0IP16_DIACI|nr:uncharacterized protein LOC103505255 [Diaphorina citri]